MSRRAALLLLGGGALTSLTATGAFSSVSGPRRVSLGTESDESALLGLTSGDDGDPAGASLNAQTVSFETYDGGSIDVAALENNVGEPIEITSLTLEPDPQDPNSSDLSIAVKSAPSNLEFGKSQTLVASVTCSTLGPGQSTGPVAVILSVTAAGESTSVSLERTITVNCRNCVPCRGGTDTLVKYEWVGAGSGGDGDDEDGDSDEDDGGDEDGDEDEEDDGNDGNDDGDEDEDDSSGFKTEGPADPNIELTGKTLDDENEPLEACFSVDYCNVDVVVKAANNYETHENRSRTVCVTDIDGKAISNIRFFCEAPDDAGVGGGKSGKDDDDEKGSGDDDDSSGGPPWGSGGSDDD
jgi:hypothetical protein